ncbi:transposase family protein [Spiroplasma endosymbiont of Zeiraphera isertana]|uniref:transposase family protein n=1 Tax=Spiroplasma endosymbiont of Zeiraphera isertana TaxID=3066313 RepID=UPI00313BE5F7
MTLEYWKDYSGYRVIAKRYNISHTSCIRNIFWIENILRLFSLYVLFLNFIT